MASIIDASGDPYASFREAIEAYHLIPALFSHLSREKAAIRLTLSQLLDKEKKLQEILAMHCDLSYDRNELDETAQESTTKAIQYVQRCISDMEAVDGSVAQAGITTWKDLSSLWLEHSELHVAQSRKAHENLIPLLF